MPPKARPTQAAPVPPARRTRGPNRTLAVATRDHSISPENFPGLAAVNAASSYESPFRGVVLFTGVPSGNLMSHQN